MTLRRLWISAPFLKLRSPSSELIDCDRPWRSKRKICAGWPGAGDVGTPYRYDWNSSTGALIRRWSGSRRSEEHTSELQSLMRISYAVFCLKKKKKHNDTRKTR